MKENKVDQDKNTCLPGPTEELAKLKTASMPDLFAVCPLKPSWNSNLAARGWVFTLDPSVVLHLNYYYSCYIIDYS